MNSFRIGMSFVLLAFLGVLVSGQSAVGQSATRPQISAAEAVSRVSGVQTPPQSDSFRQTARLSSAQNSATAKSSPAKPFGPIGSFSEVSESDQNGTKVPPGTTRVFTVHQDREFLTKGQEVSFTLEALVTIPGPISVIGTSFEPGYSGQYDQDGAIRHFYPELLNSSNWLENGVTEGQLFKSVITKKMVGADRDGQHIISFLFIDGNGRLLQQTFNYFYLNYAGPSGLYTWRTDEVIQSTFGDFPIMILKGKYPINQIVWITLGKADYNIPKTKYAAVSSDGTTILLLRPYLTFRAMEFDVTILDMESRVSQTKIAAGTLPAAPNN